MLNRIKSNFLFALICVILSPVSTLNAQKAVSEKFKEKLTQKAGQKVAILSLNKNEFSESKYHDKMSSSFIERAHFFNINQDAIDQIRLQNLDLIIVDCDIPGYGRKELGLYRQNIFTSDLHVETSTGEKVKDDIKKSMFYRGVVIGEEESLVTLTMVEDNVMGVIAIDNDVFNLGKMKNAGNMLVLYNEKAMDRNSEFVCGALAPEGADEKPLEITNADKTVNCVRIRVEVDSGLRSLLGGTSAANNYVAGLFNQVVTLYANDDINVIVSEIFVWSGSSPYSGGSYNILNQMNNNSPNADLTTLLSTQSSGGIAWLSGLCSNNFGVNFNSVDGYYNNIPTYSWDVNVVTHEIGHNLSSPHTHACAWNGNNTPIDGCGAVTGSSEGCNGAIPSNGGTIMSYCHLTNVGVNFNLGFGPQPGSRIRNYVNNSYCLGSSCGGSEPSCNDGFQNGNETGIDCGGSCAPCPTCNDGIQNGDETGVDCGGPSCVDCGCDDDQVYLSITFDEYPQETSWEIRNQTNAIVASGDGYNNQSDGSTLNVPICIEEGCYTFYMIDSYGDGICCQYGQGSYTLSDASGNQLVSGSEFSHTDASSFCFGNAMNGLCQFGIPSTFTLRLDGEPEETKWEIFSDNQYLVAEGSGYGGQANTTVVEELCLPAGCYRFSISDADGDGFCCTSGAGYYELVNDANNVVVISGDGNIGFEEVVYFCVSNEQIQPEANPNKFQESHKGIQDKFYEGFDLYPNPSNGQINLKVNETIDGESLITINDLNGALVLSLSQSKWQKSGKITLDVSELENGIYIVTLASRGVQFSKKFVRID